MSYRKDGIVLIIIIALLLAWLREKHNHSNSKIEPIEHASLARDP